MVISMKYGDERTKYAPFLPALKAIVEETAAPRQSKMFQSRYHHFEKHRGTEFGVLGSKVVLKVEPGLL
jgi:hypothetical protein